MRLAEVVGALTLAADVSSGLPAEKGLRTVVIACRLARLAGIAGEALEAVFWTSALRFVGCTGFAPEEAVFSAGDDISLRSAMVYADFDRPLELMKTLARRVAPEASAAGRATGIARFALDRDAPRRYARAHCESAQFFARTLEMPAEVAVALDVTGERWDGKGLHGRGGDELPLAARVADVADVLELFWWAGGEAHAREVLGQRRGRTLDPALVDAAVGAMTDLVAGLDEGSAWDAYIAAEVAPCAPTPAQIDGGCVALGQFADLTSRYTAAHSRRVARLAEAAGQSAGLSSNECATLRRAGSVHDLGRVAVTAGTWDKAGPLNAIEWQRVRAHSHHTDVVLRGAGLEALADIAGATHERGQGTGYPKGVAIDRAPFLSRIVAAADVMAALGELRPHRPARDAAVAAKELRALAADGALDARAVQAVLEASGVETGRKRAWPAGLSDREVEVVRLVAIGRTNKEIAAVLGMSPRTAQKHVMNVYDKCGRESRAGLALFAVEHGLLDDGDH